MGSYERGQREEQAQINAATRDNLATEARKVELGSDYKNKVRNQNKRDAVQANNARILSQQKSGALTELNEGYLAAANTEGNKINQLEETVKQLQKESKLASHREANRSTIDAVKNIIKSGDVTAVNKLMAQNPIVKDAIGSLGYQSFTELNASDENLLAKNNLKYSEDLKTRYFKGLKEDGTYGIVDMVGFLSTTNLANNDLTGKLTAYNDEQMQLQQNREQEREQQLSKATGAIDTAKANKEAELKKVAYGDQTIKTRKTAHILNTENAESKLTPKAKEALTEVVGDTRLDPETLDSLGSYAAANKSKLSSANIKQLASAVSNLDSYNTIVGTAYNAEKLSGIRTNLVASIKAYTGFSNSGDLDTSKGRVAYSAIASEIRHTLYGAALTKNEVKYFEQLMGTLVQSQPGLILKLQEQFKRENVTLKTYAGTIADKPSRAFYYNNAINASNIVLEKFNNISKVYNKLLKSGLPMTGENVKAFLDDEANKNTKGKTPKRAIEPSQSTNTSSDMEVY